ncbi:MAG: hypothetical protein Q9219_005956 [cf. Caloplaca sp. 3 TL-2023]
MLGCIKLNEEPWTVAKFVRAVIAIIEDMARRGKLPIIVGGTHYYMQSLLFESSLVSAGAEHQTADALERRWPILAASTSDMLDELQKIDPEEAARWHPKDRRKIRHSLEVYLTSGRRPSDLYREQHKSINATKGSEPLGAEANGKAFPSTKVGLSSTRFLPLILWIHADLHILSERLDQRVRKMEASGLVEEVKELQQYLQRVEQSGTQVDMSSGIWTAIGFKELLPYVLASQRKENTTDSLERMKNLGIEKTQAATKQYAKRQKRWIQGRFLRALQDHNMLDNVMLLNGTDPSKWQHDVEIPANDAVSAFLTGEPLPRTTMSPNAVSQILTPHAKPQIKARYCPICDMTLMTQKEWEHHPRSKKHRRATKSAVDWQALYPKLPGQD